MFDEAWPGQLAAARGATGCGGQQGISVASKEPICEAQHVCLHTAASMNTSETIFMLYKTTHKRERKKRKGGEMLLSTSLVN